MYGTRRAATNWQQHYAGVLVKSGFIVGKKYPCVFYHPNRDISTVVHGDDFTSLAKESDLIWFRESLKRVFEIDDRGIMGPGERDIKEIRLLNRIVAWESTGIRYEADQRHAEILIESLGLTGAKGVDPPGTPANKLSDDDTEPLPKEQQTLYRAAAARCNFLGLDRPDIQYAAKEVSRGMANPTQGDLIRLKRLASI